jgi:uncharacterized protein
MTTASESPLSFSELARLVIEREKKPLTVDEIWAVAEQTNLISRLQTTGKTPKATLGARLYTDANVADGLFQKVGARPARFILKSLLKNITQESLEKQLAETPAVTPKAASYAERDLHSLLVRFAYDRFATFCKTIYHEKSVKKGQKHNQWLHPDIVGFSLTTQGWTSPVVSLVKSSGALAAKLYSFELKTSIDFTTLREYFFQAVSNSSWAHEGYLVIAEIEEDPEFMEELKRLSQSFGIGVIQLDTVQVEDSEILLAARERSEVDWETVNRITEINPDFKGFVESVGNSITINQIAAKGFDAVLADTDLAAHLKRFVKKSIRGSP